MYRVRGTDAQERVIAAAEAWSGGGQADNPRALDAATFILGDASRRAQVKRIGEVLAAHGEAFNTPSRPGGGGMPHKRGTRGRAQRESRKWAAALQRSLRSAWAQEDRGADRETDTDGARAADPPARTPPPRRPRRPEPEEDAGDG